MERIAKFEKVSFAQFEKDWKKCFPELTEKAKEIYDGIALPKRATTASAGYDFFAPCDIVLKNGKSALIPTGIRAKIRQDYVLTLFPRSSLGFKYRMQLNNTVGVIDADYYGAENEGHIMAKITNDALEDVVMEVPAGKGFMQGIFLCYGITEDDEVSTIRTGGIGSTTGGSNE